MRRKNNKEIEVDEIFPDQKNAPGFHQESMEGMLENPIQNKIFWFLGVFLILALTVFGLRVGYLQLAKGGELKERSEKNYLRVVNLETQRGIIYDKDGNLLAYNDMVEAENLRKYPPVGFLHVSGFLTAPEKEGDAPRGASGLEATYDDILRGAPDKNIEEVDAKGNVIEQGILEKGQEGKNILTGISMGLNIKLAEAINDTKEERGFTGGAGVFMDIKSGEILALVSAPEFDPNLLSKKNTSEEINKLIHNEGKPFLNRAIAGLYAPGSIVKPALAAGALLENIITPDKKILSMPPIINSHETGKVTETTKDVFVECSGFDFEVLKKCLNIIVTSLADMGGEVYQMEVKYNKKEITPELKPETLKVSLENTNKLLGLNLAEKQFKKFIEMMGHNYNKGVVSYPAWRMDILHEVDIIEDVAIAFGYDEFIPELPKISTIGEKDVKEILKQKFSNILTGLNMLEVSNYHLTNMVDMFEKMGYAKNDKPRFIEVEDSKTDYKILRGNLTHFLLKVLSENTDAEYPQRIFEIGKVFDVKENISEKNSLGVAVAPGNFTQVKQVLEYLFRMVGLILEFKESENPPVYFIDGRVAEVLFENKRIGFIGEIHPKVLKKWKMKMPVALFEINLEEVFNKLQN